MKEWLDVVVGLRKKRNKMDNKMYLLGNGPDEAYRKLYIPQGTEKTNGLAAQIIFNVKEHKINISIGEDFASEKAVGGNEYLYTVVNEFEIPDRVANWIKEKARLNSLEEELQPEIFMYLFKEP